jgi:hypothetical protein
VAVNWGGGSMVYLSQYEISTDGSKISLLAGFDYLRTQLDGSLLVRGPANSAGQLIKLPGVLAVREIDEYTVDLSNNQATIKQGSLLVKKTSTPDENQPKQMSIIMLIEIGTSKGGFKMKYSYIGADATKPTLLITNGAELLIEWMTDYIRQTIDLGMFGWISLAPTLRTWLSNYVTASQLIKEELTESTVIKFRDYIVSNFKKDPLDTELYCRAFIKAKLAGKVIDELIQPYSYRATSESEDLSNLVNSTGKGLDSIFTKVIVLSAVILAGYMVLPSLITPKSNKS